MMRDIKFRAWDRDLKMYEDNYHIVIDLDGQVWNQQNGESTMAYELEQFTGLYDMNGMAIYEGDILRKENKSVFYIVEFLNGAFMKYDISGRYYGEFQNYDAESLEIIGNIHENPEYLK